MGTQILNDIYCDLKLLITCITGFKPPEEGFRICEKFVVSNIKYHSYLSVNSNATKKAIQDVKEKFIIHARYNLANEFINLVDTFLTSFNFDQHPEHDLQWSLLFLLLNLSSTNTSTIEYGNKDLLLLQSEKTIIAPSDSEEKEIDGVDWCAYLKDDQDDFFCDYQNHSSDSDCAEFEDNQEKDEVYIEEIYREIDKLPLNTVEPTKTVSNSIEKFTKIVKSQRWLDKNIENDWWNTAIKIKSQCTVISPFADAHLCKIYDQEVLNQHRQVTGLITEYQACREILWMFHIPIDMTIFEKICNTFRVRSNISIPSLTPIAFKSICSNFTDLFLIIQELHAFEQTLYNLYDTQSADYFPPLTYDTYNAALKQYFNKIRRKIISIESKAMQKNDTITLMSLSQDLKESSKELKMLFEIHQSINFEKFEKLPNWEKAYRCISSLHRELENSKSCERTNLCASLYLSSLRVYLNIIDTWLSEGRLEDFRNEFLITKTRNDLSNKSENEHKMVSFIVRRINADVKADPVIERLIKKVEEIGRNIELLVTLSRMSDMWQLNNEQYTSRIPLNDEFITEVLLELSKYSSSLTVDEPDFDNKNEFVQSQRSFRTKKFPKDLEDNIQQQVLRINNPFLLKVFQDYLPPMDISTGPTKNNVIISDSTANEAINGDTVDSETKKGKIIINDWGIKIFDRLQKISPFILPISKIVGNVLEKILDQRYSCASQQVRNILINEYKLEKHLKLMRSIYMMERGHIMKKFYNQMFQEIEGNLCRVDADYLTNILEEVLCDEWRDINSNNRWSISLANNCTRQILQAVNHTTLNYAVDWPINMILTDEVLTKYNEIFRFQLKLKWALWALNNLRFIDLEGKDSDEMKDIFYHFNVRRLECLRFWLLHAIGSIHTYLSGQVLESLGMIFEKSLSEAKNLDNIIQLHNNYLNKVYEHCLQTAQFEDIMVTINNLLGMCTHIRGRWERGVKQLLPNELDQMESNYTKYHTYLALALHNAVQHKEANYLAGLASAFNCSMPSTN